MPTKHVHQDKPLPRTPKSLGILPKKGISSYYQYQSTCSNCKRDCEVQILESDELRDDVEISRRRRLLVVSIDSSSLLFKTWSHASHPEMASSAIIACVESSPTYQPGQPQRARGVLGRLVSFHRYCIHYYVAQGLALLATSLRFRELNGTKLLCLSPSLNHGSTCSDRHQASGSSGFNQKVLKQEFPVFPTYRRDTIFFSYRWQLHHHEACYARTGSQARYSELS
jgi:hypothetical protein